MRLERIAWLEKEGNCDVVEWYELCRLARLGLTADGLTKALEMVRERWSFNDQYHTHTWHDMQDCRIVSDAALLAYRKAKEMPT